MSRDGDARLSHQRAIANLPPRRLEPVPEPTLSRRSETFVRYVAPSLILLCLVAFAVLLPGLAFIALICLALLCPSIVLHELGHLVAARRAGMQATEFSIGFGPVVWSRQWKGLTWAIKLLPLGGSVEIAGMTVEDVERRDLDPERAFIYKPPLSRLGVVLAGVGVNVLLAWASLTGAVMTVAADEGHADVATLLVAPIQGLAMLGHLVQLAAESIAHIVTSLSIADVGSILSVPTTFAQGAGAAEAAGVPLLAFVWLFCGAMNLSLALFNSLPLYPMDGYYAITSVVDQGRALGARARGHEWAPLSTWSLRWFSRGTSVLLVGFVGLTLVSDLVRLM